MTTGEFAYIGFVVLVFAIFIGVLVWAERKTGSR